MSKRDIYTTIGATNHTDYKRPDNDYYATHPSAISHLFKIEQFDNNIWECACGEGHLSKKMIELGKNVYSTDLIDRGYGDEQLDFLHAEKEWGGDIITNPPYKLANDFVLKALNVVNKGHKVAMFLKITFLEGVARSKIFKVFPPYKIWVYSFRQTVARNGNPEMFAKGSAICYAWFVWIKGNKDKPIVDWITRENIQEGLFK